MGIEQKDNSFTWIDQSLKELFFSKLTYTIWHLQFVVQDFKKNYLYFQSCTTNEKLPKKFSDANNEL